MKTPTDEQLVLLYYGEHDDPELARRVAADPALSRRFKALATDLGRLEALTPPARGADYGQRVWQALVPQLEAEAKPLAPGKRSWWNGLTRPRLSLTGAAAALLVAVLAFWMGRQTLPPEPPQPMAMNPVALDSGRLLSHRVSSHFEELGVLLTGYSNEGDRAGGSAAWATDMLIANRLYRRAAEAAGERRLAGFLADLEPLLIELAHQGQQTSPAARERLQQEAGDSLLFKLRVMNSEINHDQPI